MIGVASAAGTVGAADSESAALASMVAAGETFSIAMTVPVKTTSSDCNPGQTPGGAFEQVQADVIASQKNKIGRSLRITREVIVDIVHGAERGIERGSLIFEKRCIIWEYSTVGYSAARRRLRKCRRFILPPTSEILQGLHSRCAPFARAAAIS